MKGIRKKHVLVGGPADGFRFDLVVPADVDFEMSGPIRLTWEGRDGVCIYQPGGKSAKGLVSFTFSGFQAGPAPPAAEAE